MLKKIMFCALILYMQNNFSTALHTAQTIIRKTVTFSDGIDPEHTDDYFTKDYALPKIPGPNYSKGGWIRKKDAAKLELPDVGKYDKIATGLEIIEFIPDLRDYSPECMSFRDGEVVQVNKMRLTVNPDTNEALTLMGLRSTKLQKLAAKYILSDEEIIQKQILMQKIESFNDLEVDESLDEVQSIHHTLAWGNRKTVRKRFKSQILYFVARENEPNIFLRLKFVKDFRNLEKWFEISDIIFNSLETYAKMMSEFVQLKDRFKEFLESNGYINTAAYTVEIDDLVREYPNQTVKRLLENSDLPEWIRSPYAEYSLQIGYNFMYRINRTDCVVSADICLDLGYSVLDPHKTRIEFRFLGFPDQTHEDLGRHLGRIRTLKQLMDYFEYMQDGIIKIKSVYTTQKVPIFKTCKSILDFANQIQKARYVVIPLVQ